MKKGKTQSLHMFQVLLTKWNPRKSGTNPSTQTQTGEVFWYSLIDDKLRDNTIEENFGLIENGANRQAYSVLQKKMVEP